DARSDERATGKRPDTRYRRSARRGKLAACLRQTLWRCSCCLVAALLRLLQVLVPGDAFSLIHGIFPHRQNHRPLLQRISSCVDFEVMALRNYSSGSKRSLSSSSTSALSSLSSSSPSSLYSLSSPPSSSSSRSRRTIESLV